MMNTSTNVFSNSINSTESQTRNLMSRIDVLEKHLLEIHNSIASYVLKMAKTRDVCDVLAINILNLSETEKFNTSLKQGLNNFSQHLTAIQDFRDEEIKQMEESVINALSIYGELTRKAKEDLKSNSSARSRHLSELKDSKSRETPRSNSLSEVSNAFIAYELQLQKFEMKKICDLKKIFLEFTKSELIFHSKSLEILTKAYKSLLNIDADKDLHDFCQHFNFTQLGSPKREDSSGKTSDEQSGQKTPTLRRFNSEPNFNSNSNPMALELKPNKNDIKSEESIVETDSDDH